MTTEWKVRIRPSDEELNVLFDDQFAEMDDPDIPFDGIVGGVSTKWKTRSKP